MTLRSRGDPVIDALQSQPDSDLPVARERFDRPAVHGKFLIAGDRKLYVRGVTYGTFRPDADGHEFPPRDVVEADFATMSANGLNAVRLYTAPPRWLLDEADSHGLRVMVGLAAERLVGYLNDGRGTSEIVAMAREQVRRCSGHPAILCYAVANEIPSSIVRWFGRRRIERFLARLCEGVREDDPGALVTYVNYPSTEYLQLPFVDLLTFNVYLESPERLTAYLARLQNLAADRPLVMAEIGLDSVRNGEEQQARSLATQVETTFAAGCAGAFVYSWTDEWHRGGEDVQDWEFGLTRRDRRPKPALAAVREAFAATPLGRKLAFPHISVVVCTWNGAGRIGECLDGLLGLDYPDYDVIVIDDGSTDGTAALVGDYPFRLISTENQGLGAARNAGLNAATGEIVAYIDDDAWPDPHWLQYLARTFMEGDWAAVGGPNVAPSDDRTVAECVAHAPGGPIHVLLSDREAEHIPGCNMAFRRGALSEVGGFDPRFRTAGDDVDICWRLQARDLKVGFSPAAMVWHRRRDSVRAYLAQQAGYGRAEALLERKWPEKYNGARHIAWGGRLYGKGMTRELSGARRWRVYYGSQGTGLFQSMYQPAQTGVGALPLMPEWGLVIAALGLLSAVGATWRPLLLFAGPLLVAALCLVVAQAIASAAATELRPPPASRRQALSMRALIALLHVVQPTARLRARLRHGLSPWRCRASARPRVPMRRTWAFWSTRWVDAQQRLRLLERRLAAAEATVRRGGDYDPWDVEARMGIAARAQMLMGVEEHGGGAQLIRLRTVPRYSAVASAVAALLAVLAVAAALDHARVATGALVGLLAALVTRLLWESAVTAGAVADAVEHPDEGATPLRPGRG